jgi:DNA polymerase III epsilon subunit-like protein
MKIIIFDTETTGLPKGKNISFEDVEKWPYIVQFSWLEIILGDKPSYELNNYFINIKPEVVLSEESIKIHGITREKLEKEGVNLRDILKLFMEKVNKSDFLVAHNLNFDYNMLQVECLRNFIPPKIPVSLIQFCTMKYGEGICDIYIAGKYGKKFRKFPRLGELYIKLFNEEVENYHDARVDIICCGRCFLKMIDYGSDLFNIFPDLYKFIKNKE